MRTTTVRPDVFECVVGMEGTLSVYAIAADEPTLVDAGAATSVDALETALHDVGLDLGSVRNLVVGHYHLDHAGGAAVIVKRSDCRVYLHESMVDWLVTPDRLDYLGESTADALGPIFDQVGVPSPLPEANVERVADAGRTIDVGDRPLELIHTPGHSPDHLAVWSPADGILFVNEAIGRYYARADVFVPPTTIPKYDPDRVRDNIERLRRLDPDVVALSHGGVFDDPAALFERAAAQLERFEEEIPALYDANDRDLESTIAAVRGELAPLDSDYSAATAASTAEICTRCVLATDGQL